jgi:hypothetical protein
MSRLFFDLASNPVWALASRKEASRQEQQQNRAGEKSDQKEREELRNPPDGVVHNLEADSVKVLGQSSPLDLESVVQVLERGDTFLRQV